MPEWSIDALMFLEALSGEPATSSLVVESGCGVSTLELWERTDTDGLMWILDCIGIMVDAVTADDIRDAISFELVCAAAREWRKA
jgi:hypothetical protein